MKRTVSVCWIVVCCGLLAACCGRDPESRNRSKGVENEYAEGCVYRAPFPYGVEPVAPVPNGGRVRNVVLMIGDGMGLEQVSAALVANRGALYMAGMPCTGLSRTYSADHLITDSGAGGTALAAGRKAGNYSVGVGSDGRPLRTLVDVARDGGRRTGVCVVCRLNDATPADFCCHDTDRDAAWRIAAGYPDCGVDFIAGGGMKYWRDRPDGRDILAEMAAKGYRTCRTFDELDAADRLPVVAVLDTLELPVALERGGRFRGMVRKALGLLDNPDGFFLMVEGSCIDDWCHANRIDRAVEETLDFDRTVGDVLRWAAADGETLVVVTADHATGGLTLLDGDLAEGLVRVNFASEGHNGILVPVFAYGPRAAEFTGMYENCELSRRIARAMGEEL